MADARTTSPRWHANLVKRPPGAGRTRTQRAYKWLHRIALLGMGYGTSDWETSGELALLGRLRDTRPAMRVIIDAGANVGGWARAAHAIWPAAVIHAFEPATDTFNSLLANVGGLPVVAVRGALSGSAGTAVLHEVPGLSGLSSLHDRDLASHDLSMHPSEVVDLVRLDDYAAANDLHHIDFLKIDVEGHELEVLRGSSGLIARGAIDFIQFEFGGTDVDARVFLRDFVRLLEPWYRIDRVLTDGLARVTWSEFEEVFVTCNFLATSVRCVPDGAPDPSPRDRDASA